MSKNITSRRRSLYLTSPGLEGAIWLAVTDFTGGRRGRLVRLRRPAARDAALQGGLGTDRLFQFLELEDLDVLLLAVFGDVEVLRRFRPLMGLPLLSLTVTSTTTSWSWCRT